MSAHIADSAPLTVVSPPEWLSSIPASLLLAELQSRDVSPQEDQPACGSGKSKFSYNTPLHIGALFLILTLSTLACSFPIVVRRFPRLPVPNHLIFLSRHFGTGVLIATAFVHLLPTAYVNLTDPCLPRFWNRTYPAMAGFIAMVSVLFVVGVEMFFAIKGAVHSHSLDLETLRRGGEDSGEEREGKGKRRGTRERHTFQHRASGSFMRFRTGPLGGEEEEDEQEEDQVPYSDERRISADAGSIDKPLPSLSRSRDGDEMEEDEDDELDDLDPMAEEDTAPLTGRPDSTTPAASSATSSQNGHARRPGHNKSRQVSFADTVSYHDPSSSSSTDTASEKRLILQCLLLEAGILFHSVFIGMALSVSTGPSFAVLLVAISFHQTFEGLALGSRIAAIRSFSTTSTKPWLMSLMYGVTTPIGQAIGLAVHTLYDPSSQFGLLTVGIVNAISSGLLLYAGLVQLVAEDFLSDHSYVELKGKRRIQACGCVVAGCMLMALVGAFA